MRMNQVFLKFLNILSERLYQSPLLLTDSTFSSYKVSLRWRLTIPITLLGRLLSLVAQSCLTLYDPMDCSMPGFPVHHQLLEFTQTHVHHAGDAIQPSNPLSSPSPAFNLSQHQIFSNESVFLIRWPKYWSFSFSISPSNEYSRLISFRID